MLITCSVLAGALLQCFSRDPHKSSARAGLGRRTLPLFSPSASSSVSRRTAGSLPEAMPACLFPTIPIQGCAAMSEARMGHQVERAALHPVSRVLCYSKDRWRRDQGGKRRSRVARAGGGPYSIPRAPTFSAIFIMCRGETRRSLHGVGVATSWKQHIPHARLSPAPARARRLARPPGSVLPPTTPTAVCYVPVVTGPSCAYFWIF